MSLPISRLYAAILAGTIATLNAQDNIPPAEIQLGVTNGVATLEFPLLPAIEQFNVLSSSGLDSAFQVDTTGESHGFIWTNYLGSASKFFQLQINPLSSNALLNATLLNRLGYGPTPDELERVNSLGPDAYINEQLAPESIVENLDIDRVVDQTSWQFVTATGTASSQTLYIYLNKVGDAYIDDVRIVAGTVPEVGVNLIKNGDFEQPLAGSFTVSTNLTNSEITSSAAHSGANSLHLISTSPGTTQASSVWQTATGLKSGSTYTLSYWFLPGSNYFASATVRLSGSGITSAPNTLGTRLASHAGVIDDLRAWHVLHAVRSKKQLLETLLQFIDNHFVTQVSKTRDYFDRYYDGSAIDAAATSTEYAELQRWRTALLNPQCTFYDLLKISAESPAMIIYLDTVGSTGNGSNIANENYARELLELFTFGVDNGYDQADITTMSKAWTGWTIRLVDLTNQFDQPFAPQSTVRIPGATNSAISNLVGAWAFNYKSASHNTSSKTLFPNKVVPARFGPPYANRPYQLILNNGTTTNSIQDGYQVLRHIADQPFAQEFLSVKLCRLFVHDDFAIGYDFTDPNLSSEGQLVRACMTAWENGNPKGQIRQILRTIFESELFRSHGGSMQKVRTPFEFTAAAVRALRSLNSDGTYTAETDGYSLKAPMARMGSMSLFDRAEPDGYPESAPAWISAGTLAERLRFVQSLLTPTGQAAKSDAGNSVTDPVRLLKNKLPAANWNDAIAVSGFFIQLLWPGEGRANLELYQEDAVKYLNTADDGIASSPFDLLANTTANYDSRVRGMVGMLMTLQRFEEQ
ncbi:MAG: hypothetical protein JWM99_3362 [Verrucomicrobiales bacterium]|nr:hypothetical protein [Verrucomicrobiales bacterium]